MKKKKIQNSEQIEYEMKRKKIFPPDESYPETEQNKDKDKEAKKRTKIPVKKNAAGQETNTDRKGSENDDTHNDHLLTNLLIAFLNILFVIQ